MRFSQPTWRQPPHARHAPRPCTARLASAATRAYTNKATNSRRRDWSIAYPTNAPAVEDWIYEYGLLDEFAVNAYWTGKYAECVDACDRLMNEGKLPIEERDRVLKNRQFGIDKLAEVKMPKAITLECSVLGDPA